MTLFKVLLFICLMCAALITEVSAATYSIVVPGPTNEEKVRNPYVETLLQAIFEVQNHQLTISYSPQKFHQARALELLSEGKAIDLNWSMFTKEREQQFRTIKIPIYKGLIGERLMLIHPDSQVRFNKIKTLKDLKKLIGVQRFDWPDYKILIANGLTIEGNLYFNTMYKVVDQGLADYFPRSVIEVGNEVKKQRTLVVEETILLSYPSAYYFFVHKDNQELALLIERGFNLLIDTGKFERLFNRFHKEKLEKLQLNKRKVFRLNNPLL